jgi:carboxymethylenebutenolidase
MTDKKVDPRVIDLYNDYIHGEMPRRTFLRRVATVVGGAAAASAVLPLVESNWAWGQQVAVDDAGLDTGYEEYTGLSSPVRAYVARPAGAKTALPGILVIHENRGLNAHIEDVARRAALAGFVAVAPDGLSYVGGAPADQERARDEFRNADTEHITSDVMSGVAWLAARADCTGKVGSVGFCYGGGVALQCAVTQAATAAAVSFYGRALSAENTAAVKIPLMMHYAGNDQRINAMIPEFRVSLDSANVAYSLHMYPGTGHGFHNDTSQARYDKEAATLAWRRTLAFFKHSLA